MALDRYDSTGRIQRSISLDPANAKEAIRSSQSLEGRLDRISGFLYKDLEIQKKEEGLNYGVTNRPTLEQIKTATYSGEDASELFVEGGTVFGDAAREAQAELYRQDLEYDLTNYFSNIMSGIQAGAPIDDPNAIARDMQGKIDAASTILRDISPKQNLKFRAGTTAIGNKVYDNINKIFIERVTAENQAKFLEGNDIYGNMVYEELLTPDENGRVGNLITTEAYMSITEGRLKKLIQSIPGAVEANTKSMYDIKQIAYKRATQDYILQNQDKFVPPGSNLILEIKKGNVGEFSEVYTLMTQDQKDKLLDSVLSDISNSVTLQTNEAALIENANNDLRVNTLTDFGLGKIRGIEVIGIFKKAGMPISNALITSLTNPQTETDFTIRAEAELEQDLGLGYTSEEDLVNAATARQITWTGYSRLLKKYTRITTNLKPGIDEIKRGLQLEEYNKFALIPTLTKPVYAQLVGQLNVAAENAAASNQMFNAYEAAQTILNSYAGTQNAQDMSKALTILNDLLKTGNGINVSNYELYDSEEELRALDMNLDQTDINNILTQTKLLRRAEERAKVPR
jgi:hypothetical protein